MEDEGHFCSEDSILRYIKQLRNELGVDIISSRGRNARYFIGGRLLEKEELKLIIDSINASNFIEKGIAARMIDKLKSTMSVYDSLELDRSVLGINIAKAENRKILYNVNLIQEALTRGVQISFDYMVWNKNKRLVKKSERRYNMNPKTLIWANDRYYLYGYDIKETDGKLLVTFNAVASEILLGWLLGLQSVEVLEPKEVRDKMIELINQNKDLY
jgi:predicted DNA-binding transcriptional regulator YafY